jgi:hypothetical protein
MPDSDLAQGLSGMYGTNFSNWLEVGKTGVGKTGVYKMFVDTVMHCAKTSVEREVYEEKYTYKRGVCEWREVYKEECMKRSI